ncbi:MAG: SUMF1/EgtB/PvdO family nonheme iron enzyme [Desulfobacula sp.]|nr:SUMF1/EgtB/PvdO family nonheme iron enzyme [Desulfobacula sp.]
MKSLKSFFLITAVILFSFFGFLNQAFGVSGPAISPSGKKVTGDQWLFVIGINTYIEWPRLDTAANDARSVKKALLSRYHFDKEHLIELYDDEATRANIIGKLRFLAQNLKKDDSLFLFYAGHGHLDPITKSGSWIPVESGTKDVSAWISNNYIKGYLKSDAIKAKHVLLVSDSCFSGDFFRSHRGKLPEVTDEVIRRSYALTSRQAITSGGLEPVSDSGFGNNSVFTHFLVKAFENNQLPFLIPSEFFTDIKAGVAENAEQLPRFGSLKNTGGQQGGEFVFFLRQNVRLDNLSRIEAQKHREYERLKKMELEADTARRKEAKEIALRERELSELDQKINAMKNRLGSSEVKTDDSLDTMLAMVKQKEDQAKRLERLRKQKKAEQKKREAEIAQLKIEREEKIIAALETEVKKYKEIISSEYGINLKKSAWKALIAKCPPGWADGIEEGNCMLLLRNSLQRKPPWKDPETGMEFVYVPGGCFKMGSHSASSDEKPVHEVCVDPFWIGKYEVTQGQWKKIMGDNPSKFRSGNDFPVERVSWNDAKKFISRLKQQSGNTFRLPTEAQWEYAARSGGKNQTYAGGNNLDSVAWYSSNSGNKTHRVGTKSSNGLGIYDMSGNVWEWCEDVYDENAYSKHGRNNPVVISGGSSHVFRVDRGGSWYDNPRYVRAANRGRNSAGRRFSGIGFRLCLSRVR